MPSLGGDQYKWYCEIPPLAEPGNYPGGVKTKPPFEMGVDDFENIKEDGAIMNTGTTTPTLRTGGARSPGI